jgi:hypothetical protein
MVHCTDGVMVRRGGLKTGLIKRDKKLASTGEERGIAKNVLKMLQSRATQKTSERTANSVTH